MTDAVSKSIIVIDIDGTILARSLFDSFRLYIGSTDRVGTAFGVMPQILRELSERYRIVALTARAERSRTNTKAWFVRHNLDFVEVLHSPVFHIRESSRYTFKSSALAKLGTEGCTIAYGVGDRLSDFRSYVENKIFPLVILRPHQSGRRKRLLSLARKLGLSENDYAVFEETAEKPAWPLVQSFISSRTK